MYHSPAGRSAINMSRTLMQLYCRRSLHATSAVWSLRKPTDPGGLGTLAIRREAYNPWERRAPLNPQQVKTLVRQGYEVLVQPSTRRAYTMNEYANAGAAIVEDIDRAQIIFGVKTPPVELITPDKTYVFFSHTIKGQKEQMPLLDALLEKRVRLIDYEKLEDEKGKRLVAFGQYAGICGMVDILHGLGLRLLALGYHTPFMYIGSAHNYLSSSAAKAAVNQLGREIQLGLLPESLGPLVFTFTGRGNVAQGAQDVFQELPNEYVSPNDLEEVMESGDIRKVYGVVVSKEDYLEHKEGKKFDSKEFDKHPHRYVSTFAEKIAPYTTVLVNGIYWEPGYPRLLTTDDMHKIQGKKKIDPNVGIPGLPQKLLAIGDISCDLAGSIEFIEEYTSFDAPFRVYNAHTGTHTGDVSDVGTMWMSIDNLPAQLPREATDYFGQRLLPLVDEMFKLQSDQEWKDISGISQKLLKSVITYNGKLTPKYEYISRIRQDA